MSTLDTSGSAERELLAALAFHGPEALVALHAEGLDATAFGEVEHGEAFRTMVALVQEQHPITPATFDDQAAILGLTRMVGNGQAVLDDLADIAVGFSNVRYHAQIVLDAARRRAATRAAGLLTTALADPSINPDAAIAEAIQTIGDVSMRRRKTASNASTLLDAVAHFEEQARLGGTIPGLSTGMPRLDDLLDGLEKSRLIVVAARPGCGKTAFGVACAHTASSREDAETLFWTGEQPVKVLQQRRLGFATGLNIRHHLRMNTYGQHAGTIAEAANTLAGMPLSFDDEARTPAQLRQRIMAEVAMGRAPRLVVVDYLTKLRPDSATERNDLGVGQMTSALARIALDFDLTVLCLAQLNRSSVREGKPRRPVVSDLRDSGLIEQDADQVVLMWEPPPPDGVAEEPRGSAEAEIEFCVDKNRHGPVGSVRATWRKGVGSFTENPAWRHGRAG